MPERAHPRSPSPRRRARSLAHAPRRILRARVAWVSLAAILAVGGTLGAALAGRAVSRSDADHARLAFRLASAEIAASLKQAIQHEEDLIVSASAFVRSDPRATTAEFARWTGSVGAMKRYPELQNIGLARIVPARRLRAFAARQAAEPLRALGARGASSSYSLQIEPPGRRPYYCLAVAGVARSAASYIPPGVDYCALSPQLILARCPRPARLRAVQRRARHDPGSGDTGLPRSGHPRDRRSAQSCVRGMARRAADTERRPRQSDAGAPAPPAEPTL